MAKKAPDVSDKFVRKINYGLKHLALTKAIYQPSFEDFHAGLLGRELQFKSGARFYFTEFGMGHLRTLNQALVDSGVFGNRVDAEDIWQAVWAVLKSLFAKDQIPDSGAELIGLAKAKLHHQVQTRTFILPFFGIEFEQVTDFPLGEMRLIQPDVGYFTAQGLEPGFKELPGWVEHHRGLLWITGKKVGSARVAERDFRTAADATSGLLAVMSATALEEGASRFRIGVGQYGGPGRGGETWFSWSESPDSLSITSGGAHRPSVPIDPEFRRKILEATLFQKALSIIHSDKRTDLEESIARGLHWFADAQRDPVPVMQFVKYWSCIEVFFSEQNEEITKSVSAGIAAVLVFGGLGVVPEADYTKTKTRVTQLYKKRSKAVHGASREHVTTRDIVDLSRYAAWLLVNMLSMSERGYRDRKPIKAISMRLDEESSALK